MNKINYSQAYSKNRILVVMRVSNGAAAVDVVDDDLQDPKHKMIRNYIKVRLNKLLRDRSCNFFAFMAGYRATCAIGYNEISYLAQVIWVLSNI